MAGILLISAQTTAWADDYIHGYFNYTIEDQSVTITAYTGNESVVTVPAMIAGNPVNTIAPGAFAGCETVTAVILPDTIMSVEEGAFSQTQTVELSSANGWIPEPSLGIVTDDGELITTDDQGNLIVVDPQGNETVLDDTQAYVRETDGDGAVSIRNENGAAVAVDANGVVFYPGQSGGLVSAVLPSAADAHVEEADIEEAEAENAPSPSEVPSPIVQAQKPAEETASEESGSNMLRSPAFLRWIAIGLAALAIVLSIVAVFTRDKKKKQVRRNRQEKK